MVITESETTPSHETTYSLLRSVEYVCWFLGSLLTIWVASMLWTTQRFQHAQAERLKYLQSDAIQERTLRTGDVFGRISIPRLGTSAIVAEGVDEATLRHAVGHFPESSVPETGGTVALAGHRDTFFRSLAHIRMHDQITLETPSGKYTYRVERTEVVSPQHIEVIQSSPQSDLTLVTCYPFRYVGQAPERFIVQALRVRSQ
jgi:sortase A